MLKFALPTGDKVTKGFEQCAAAWAGMLRPHVIYESYQPTLITFWQPPDSRHFCTNICTHRERIEIHTKAGRVLP